MKLKLIFMGCMLALLAGCATKARYEQPATSSPSAELRNNIRVESMGSDSIDISLSSWYSDRTSQK